MLFLMTDIETDGLDPQGCRILEVAGIMLDSDLQEIGRFHSLVNVGRTGAFNVHLKVREMHEANGLFSELDALCEEEMRAPGEAPMSPFLVGSRFAQWIQSFAKHGREPSHDNHQIIMAGYGPHFDRAFFRHHWPAVEKLFWYRMRDIRALVEELRDMGFPYWGKPDGGTHRAMSDCELQLESWRRVRRELGAFRDRAAGYDNAVTYDPSDL